MAIYRFGDFELDDHLFRLRRGGSPVPIAPLPFDLLLYLLRNRHRTVTKYELINQVWQAQSVSDSSVPTCITSVRRALSDAPTNPRFIQTIRGRGYRFIGNAHVDHNPTQRDGDQRQSQLALNTLVGRNSEMGLLMSGFASALIGRPSACLVTGDAGMGKTRLLEDFAGQIADNQATVLFGRCREDEGSPAFWPWIQILRTLIDSRKLTNGTLLEEFTNAISPLLPELITLFPRVSPLPSVNPEQGRFRLLDAITRLLRTSASEQPLVLFIDDLHRADISSLILLEFLLRELRTSPILVSCAYRTAEISTDLDRSASLARIARLPVCRSFQLAGLSRNSIAQLVDQPADSRLVSVLYDQTAGNPYFLTQLLQLPDFSYRDFSQKPADDWIAALPTTVKGAIASQLLSIPPKTRAALTVASVVGRDFSPTLLSQALVYSLPDVLEILEPAFSAHIIEKTPHSEGDYRFSHGLLRDVVYDQIPQQDRIRLHQTIGSAIEALNESNQDSCIEALAHHFSESCSFDNVEKAIQYCLAAGRHATARLAHENAPEYFRKALQLLHFFKFNNPRIHCELLICLGSAELQTGDRESARNNLLEAAKIARDLGSPELLARAALSMAPGFFTIEVGAFDAELRRLLTEAKSTLPRSQTDLLVQVTARLALAAVWSSSKEACDELSERALVLAANSNNPITTAYALRARHSALWRPDRFIERTRLIADLGQLAIESQDAEIELLFRVLNITALLEVGDIASLDLEIAEYAALARSLQLPHAQWYVGLFSAMRSLMQGDFNRAKEAAERFLELGNRVHDSNATQSYGGHLVLRLWESDELNPIIDIIEQYIAEHPAVPAWKCTAAFIKSERKVGDGTYLFDRFSETGFENIPIDETWAISMHMLAYTCCNIGDAARAEKIYRIISPGRMFNTIVGYGVMSWGSRAREIGNLASLMGEFEEAQGHFQLAISQNRKTGSIPWVAHSQFDYARMLAKRRDPQYGDRIRDLVLEARRTAEQLGMIRLRRRIAEFEKDL